jgi:hypothetical protein
MVQVENGMQDTIKLDIEDSRFKIEEGGLKI